MYQVHSVSRFTGRVCSRTNINKILLDVSRGTPRLGWPMAGHLSKAFCTAICADSERKIRVRQVKKGKLYKGRRRRKKCSKTRNSVCLEYRLGNAADVGCHV